MRSTARWACAAAAAMAAGCSGGTGPDNASGAAAMVGNIFFQSSRNGTQYPAVDTIAVGQTVTWTWTHTGDTPHDIQSLGSPAFASSGTVIGDGQTYSVTIDTAGTYQYDCAIHGTAMTGTIVVR